MKKAEVEAVLFITLLSVLTASRIARPLTENVEFEIMLDLLGGVFAEGEGLGIKHSFERGKGGKLTPLMRADIDVPAMTVASGNNGTLSVEIGQAVILTDLVCFDVGIPYGSDIKMLDHISITTSPSIISGCCSRIYSRIYFLPCQRQASCLSLLR